MFMTSILREYGYLESKATPTQHSLYVCLNFGFRAINIGKI